MMGGPLPATEVVAGLQLDVMLPWLALGVAVCSVLFFGLRHEQRSYDRWRTRMDEQADERARQL